MTKWQPTASFKQWLFVSCCWGAWPGLGVSADSGFDKEIILLRVQITSFSLVTDVSTVTPRGDAPGWKAAVKFVEMPRSLGETQLRSPGSCLLLPAVLSWHYLLASPLNASLSSFAPRWKSFPSGRLMVLWGGVSPAAVLPSVPPPTGMTQRHHHFGMAFLSTPRGHVFPLMTAEWSKQLSWWDASTWKPCPTTGQPSTLPI